VRYIEDNHWWKERLDAWSHEGFNVDFFHDALREEPSRGSELLMQFEATISKNRTLKRRVTDSTMSEDEKSEWLSKLEKVEDTDLLLEKWNEDASNNRPWEPYVHKAEERWSTMGRRSNLSDLVRRMDALDPSSYSACQPLLILLDDVNSEMLISSMLDEVENDESRRREVVNEMILLLSKDGIDASDARNMSINDALEFLSSLQSKADDARKNRLRIEKEIRPYDEDLAKRLLEKNSDNLTEEVDAIVNNLSQRLSLLTSTIEEWRELGVKFPDEGKIQPHDLLDWEAGLPEIEDAVGIHLRALERWKDFETLWPDRCEDVTLVGRLDMTEQFVDMVDALDQEWRELELQGMQIIGSWEDKGFAMDIWRIRLAEEPRSAIAWLKREEKNYSEAAAIIDALMALDASIDGEDEIVRRVAILREVELDSALLEEMRSFIEIRARRGARHRSMLEGEWMGLVRRGLVDDRSTSSLSLSEFESLIANSRHKKRNSGIPVERLKSRMQEEIDRWHETGFTVDVVRDMLAENPVALAMRIALMREAVAKHEQLRRRVSVLDWTRDPELSITVNLDLSRPDRLDSLAAELPQLMMDLSQKKVVDPDFKFVAWRPHKRTRPVLIPVPKDSVGDAMEAILEEMDSTTNIEAPVEVSPREIIVEKGVTVEEEVDDEPEQTQTVEVEPPQVEKMDADNSIESQVIDEASLHEQNRDAKTETPVPQKEDIVEEIELANSSTLPSLLRALGLPQEADVLEDRGDVNAVRRLLASHVGIEPRDMRLDRLLRLSLRLMPKGDGSDSQRFALLSVLVGLAEVLSKWTRTRLESRHSGSVGELLKDAVTLGEALNRIPGPGIALPLDSDDYALPPPDDLDGLSAEVNTLKRRVLLSNSGGVR